MKLGKIKIKFSGTQLSSSEMKNVIGGVVGPSDVNCDPQASESTCNGVCYYNTYQGQCGLEFIPIVNGGTYLCACKIG